MRRSAYFVVGIMLMTVVPARPAEVEINLADLISETQKQSPEPSRISLVWWMPDEFWIASLAQDASMTSEGIEQFLTVLRPYFVVAAVDGTIGPLGGATFVDPATLAASIALVAANGERFRPLGQEAISADARNLATMMRPVLANMLGPMGENVNFFFFPTTTADGERIGEASLPGSFSIELGNEAFEWLLPLGSVLQPKVCPKDGKGMSGAWTFCPWHGVELESTGG